MEFYENTVGHFNKSSFIPVKNQELPLPDTPSFISLDKYSEYEEIDNRIYETLNQTTEGGFSHEYLSEILNHKEPSNKRSVDNTEIVSTLPRIGESTKISDSSLRNTIRLLARKSKAKKHMVSTETPVDAEGYLIPSQVEDSKVINKKVSLDNLKFVGKVLSIFTSGKRIMSDADLKRVKDEAEADLLQEEALKYFRHLQASEPNDEELQHDGASSSNFDKHQDRELEIQSTTSSLELMKETEDGKENQFTLTREEMNEKGAEMFGASFQNHEGKATREEWKVNNPTKSNWAEESEQFNKIQEDSKKEVLRTGPELNFDSSLFFSLIAPQASSNDPKQEEQNIDDVAETLKNVKGKKKTKLYTGTRVYNKSRTINPNKSDYLLPSVKEVDSKKACINQDEIDLKISYLIGSTMEDKIQPLVQRISVLERQVNFLLNKNTETIGLIGNKKVEFAPIPAPRETNYSNQVPDKKPQPHKPLSRIGKKNSGITSVKDKETITRIDNSKQQFDLKSYLKELSTHKTERQNSDTVDINRKYAQVTKEAKEESDLDDIDPSCQESIIEIRRFKDLEESKYYFQVVVEILNMLQGPLKSSGKITTNEVEECIAEINKSFKNYFVINFSTKGELERLRLNIEELLKSSKKSLTSGSRNKNN